jgi:hypothetical protein
MKWWEKWSPLAVAVVLMGGAAIALEQEQIDGAAGLAAVGFVLTGVWIAIQLHELWKDDDHDRDPR